MREVLADRERRRREYPGAVLALDQLAQLPRRVQRRHVHGESPGARPAPSRDRTWACQSAMRAAEAAMAAARSLQRPSPGLACRALRERAAAAPPGPPAIAFRPSVKPVAPRSPWPPAHRRRRWRRRARDRGREGIDAPAANRASRRRSRATSAVASRAQVLDLAGIQGHVEQRLRCFRESDVPHRRSRRRHPAASGRTRRPSASCRRAAGGD